MCDPGLQQLTTSQGSLVRVRHDVNERDTVKPDHLLKVDESRFIAVDVIDRKTEVGAIRVRLEDVAPEWRGRLGSRDMQKD